MAQSLINLLDATNVKESDDEEMKMEPEDYETDDEDEKYTSSFIMIYLLGLEVSSETYVKNYNRIYSVFVLSNDQDFLLPPPPPNSYFLAKQDKISRILTPEVAFDTLNGPLSLISLYSLIFS